MHYTQPCPVQFAHPHPRPRPRFCIFRPGGLLAPLIPVDELPSWLQICNWSPDMYMGLQPVSLSFIQREGEYDVICHHCSSSVDSLHQSLSERIDDGTPSPRSPASHTQSCPDAVFAPAPCGPSLMVLKPPMNVQVLGQPPFHAALQNPLAGMCMLGVPPPEDDEIVSEPAVFQPPKSIARSKSSAGSQRSDLKSQAAPLDPSDAPRSFHPGSERSLSLLNGSLASTRSLTAAVERLKEVIEARKLSRAVSTAISSKSGTRIAKSVSHFSGSKSSRVFVASRSRRRTRARRRRAAEKPKPVVESIVAEEKPEQPNSATKRRDRRERMARGRKDVKSGNGHWHMMMIPNWRANITSR
ncbi:hypothetical protein NUU61_000753 [Penicillium alfredii]|uniref:Uncharacterized protein n=1 Tax=Penicillium alfredii TaxID=1506179 RepID=A0A9W9GAM3_9EURO|nr:uncharacterized protein NUU61_000753 [Penicillium alfredii]KAJ5114994.1 hypothetical protein NUU61_000753 [Penicillium alfredii]